MRILRVIPYLGIVSVFIMLAMTVFKDSIVSAQTVPACDLEPVRELLNITLESFTEADEQITLETLAELQTLIGQTRAACAGLAFSSDVDGSQPVLPIQLERGTWIATAETDGIFSTKTTLTDGECDLSYGTIGTIYPGNGMVQTVITSEGCTFLLQISGGIESWTLRFEKVE